MIKEDSLRKKLTVTFTFEDVALPAYFIGIIEETEKFKEQDKLVKERVDAMNSFESYIYSIKNTIEDPEKLGNKINENDKQKMNEAINEAKTWLDNNRSADKEDFEEHQKQLER